MSFCKSPLIIIENKKLEKEVGQKYISWKWFPKKNKINKLILKEHLNLYPCGNCLNCINMKRYHWVKKLSIEKQFWKNTYFITLTYNEQNVPDELKVSDIQKFIKYLRFALKEPIKYFCCGEYGTKTKRPHYHLILFTNYNLELEFLKYTTNGILYDCKLLNKCWKNKGYIWVAYDLDNMSFAYVSSYSNKTFLKKIQNQKKLEFEKKIDDLKKTGLSGFPLYLEIESMIPDILFKKNEFIVMSKKPPLGANGKYLRDKPSSLLKWCEKEYLKSLEQPKLDDYINNEISNELLRRKKEYLIFLKNNNLYDIIKTDELLYSKTSKNKMKGFL